MINLYSLTNDYTEGSFSVQSVTTAQIRECFTNVSAQEIKTLTFPAGFDRLDWARLDYLGWRDPRARQRAYIVLHRGDRLTGIILTTTARHDAGSRAVMCTLCRFTQRFGEVSLFTAPTTSNRARIGSSVGTYICSELQCADNVNSRPLQGPLDPAPEVTIAQRRSELHARVAAFTLSVSP